MHTNLSELNISVEKNEIKLKCWEFIEGKKESVDDDDDDDGVWKRFQYILRRNKKE